MDADIHFGEVEEAQPEVRLRPDENKHYAVVAFESPRKNELPVYVDLDVMRDMESHALSDKSVELGGVMLGGQYHDSEGNAFVLVSDSLRAQHFEATKGSFKFTHDTWQHISRERDEFPEDLQMVGWYHTHPDWGVFLSGMDMFICDNFFNRPLDLALVIDPCRGDRGVFQWVDDPRERIRRIGGFYLIASRFRRAEIQQFAAQLERGTKMPQDTRFNPVAGQVGPAQAPVVNLTDSRGSWNGPALVGMMLMQFILLAIIGWKVLLPPATLDDSEKEQKAQAEQFEKLEGKVDKLLAAEQTDLEGKVQARVLERVVTALGQGDGEIVQQFAQQQRQLDRVESEKRGYQAMEREWLGEQAQLNAKVKSLTQQKNSLATRLEGRNERISEYVQDLKKQKEKVALLEKEVAKLKSEDDGDDDIDKQDKKLWNPVTIGIAIGVALLLTAAMVGVFVMQRREAMFDEEEMDNDDEALDKEE